MLSACKNWIIYIDRCTVLLLCPWFVPSSEVAGLLCWTQSPSLLSYILQASFHRRFGHRLLLFPGTSTFSILLTMCSSFILITWPNNLGNFSCYFQGRLLSLQRVQLGHYKLRPYHGRVIIEGCRTKCGADLTIQIYIFSEAVLS